MKNTTNITDRWTDITSRQETPEDRIKNTKLLMLASKKEELEANLTFIAEQEKEISMYEVEIAEQVTHYSEVLEKLDASDPITSKVSDSGLAIHNQITNTTWLGKLVVYKTRLRNVANAPQNYEINKTILEQLTADLNADVESIVNNPNSADHVTRLNVGEKLNKLDLATQLLTSTNKIITNTSEIKAKTEKLIDDLSIRNNTLTEEINDLEKDLGLTSPKPVKK